MMQVVPGRSRLPQPRALRPGPIVGAYPERRIDPLPDTEQTMRRFVGSLKSALTWKSAVPAFPRDLQQARASIETLTDDELLERARAFRLAAPGQIAKSHLDTALAFAIEAIRRSESIELYPVQWLAATQLMRGRLVEMETGEGKSLVFVAAALALALYRIPVHVMTVNDYLVTRDAETAARIARRLGIVAAPVTPAMDDSARRHGYGADVVYVTNKQLGFDYLRDRLAGANSARLLRGLCAGLVDEADSVLIDEARTALIISREAPGPATENVYRLATAIAQALTPQDYLLDVRDRRAMLTHTGRQRIESTVAAPPDPIDEPVTRIRLEELVGHALAAQHCFVRDRDYVVEDGTLVIVDANTGRKLPDRRWDADLHRMIELKEGLAAVAATEPLASISLQRLLPRYRLLAGATGTAMEVAAELWAQYGLSTVRVPTHRRSRRSREGFAIFRSESDRESALMGALTNAIHRKRPVLIGTASVEASRRVSELLTGAGIEHVVLNGMQDADEADIVAGAGASGRVTVATNIAGRGTDIRLDANARAAGGLLVISTTFHDSGRIDRQLIGRCGRQGDPGGFVQLAALADPLFTQQLPQRLLTLASASADRTGRIAPLVSVPLLWLARRLRANGDARERERMVRAEARRIAALGFVPEAGS